MSPITRRGFLGVTATGLGGIWLGEAPPGSLRDGAWAPPSAPSTISGGIEALYKRFQDPDRKYSIRPFWFWNGKLEGEELSRQIRQMVEHGVFGAYAHNRDGLETPYLSEAWWQAVGAALKTAREAGFSFCVVDDFEWPSGEARDYWLPGINKSRVVAANPDFRMRRLRPVETVVSGPKRLDIPLSPETTVVVVGRRLGPDRLDGESLRTLTWEANATTLPWQSPTGEWLVTTYSLEPTQGPDGGTVDLMNAAAVHKFIEIYYEEFYRRYGEYFGNTFVASFADHEGSYGGTLPWTPRLFETFQSQKGYSLEPFLPALVYDIGDKTEKLRCDFLDVVSYLYANNFFKQIDDWCRAHKLQYSGHVWEESLLFGPWVQGDFYRILRAMGNPGCDTLLEWGRQSVWLKEVASVADFEGRRMVCENQGVQGADSYLSPERMRRVSNCLGAWNVSEFIPHAFDYDLERINFPPDWFRSQPFLPHFHDYADQMRRISFMNSESHHVADLLLYYPQVSVWGQAAPAFRTQGFTDILSDTTWSQDAAETNSTYALLKVRLSEERLDYLAADDAYLAESRLDGNALAISDSRFRTLILPPMSTIRRRTAQRVSEFYQAGGTVIAVGRLPLISTEEGRNDPQLKALWEATFVQEPTRQAFTLRSNASGGHAYLVTGSVEDVVELLRQIVDRDVEVTSGPTDHLYVLHKRKEGLDFYWVVNDTPASRTNQLRLRATGRAERWDAHTGKSLPIFYQTDGSHTVVRLALAPWDAAYIIFDPAGPPQPLGLHATNLEEFSVERASANEVLVRGRAAVAREPAFIELREGAKLYRGEYRPAPSAPLEITGEWRVKVDAPVIPIPYAQVKDDPQDRGLREHWFTEGLGEPGWNQLWLSPMNCSIRQWNLLGPFPNPADQGLDQAFPPEKEIDYQVNYGGDAGRQIAWHAWDAAEEVMERPLGGWNLGPVGAGGGPYAPTSNIVDYGKALRLVWPLSGTLFAQTNVYVPETQEGVIILATPNPCAVWINDRQAYSRWLRPLYHELTDGFAFRIPGEFRAGWNSLLLKFLHEPTSAKAGVFTCRVEGREGSPLKGLWACPRRLPSDRRNAPAGLRWLRFPAPPLAGALRVPHFEKPWQAFVDGKPVPSQREIPLPRGTHAVTLRVAASEVLGHPFECVATPATVPLGTWTVPGLEHFSGQMTYEKAVEVSASLLAERVWLDCGQVGVLAEAWVNGAYVGARPWQPYVFDVSKHLRAGRNQLKVRVANTEANARAVGTSLPNLKNIDLNGWLGPARLVPYLEREIRCLPGR